MSSFKNLEMAAALSAHNHIEIKKSLFSQKAVYTPTASQIDITIAEYTPTDGERLAHLLRQPLSRLTEELKAKGCPHSTPIGQFRLEAAVSKDGQFAAVQLFRFNDFTYTAASDLLMAEGSDAAILTALLNQ